MSIVPGLWSRRRESASLTLLTGIVKTNVLTLQR